MLQNLYDLVCCRQNAAFGSQKRSVSLALNQNQSNHLKENELIHEVDDQIKDLKKEIPILQIDLEDSHIYITSERHRIPKQLQSEQFCQLKKKHSKISNQNESFVSKYSSLPEDLVTSSVSHTNYDNMKQNSGSIQQSDAPNDSFNEKLTSHETEYKITQNVDQLDTSLLYQMLSNESKEHKLLYSYNEEQTNKFSNYPRSSFLTADSLNYTLQKNKTDAKNRMQDLLSGTFATNRSKLSFCYTMLRKTLNDQQHKTMDKKIKAQSHNPSPYSKYNIKSTKSKIQSDIEKNYIKN
ncbi:UNKNOWN [Stylonychia lemnae]|uniref:Uncharacterized protein n=1 Tax=Stylonychia lemnae TaxID=5949 RepID=A0A078B8T3_STYLE|nr:UNKNOWN [Stylonychia lemnae]|eukprot:CDW90636.1 UNKNOWN [Stylonychia lemnae]